MRFKIAFVTTLVASMFAVLTFGPETSFADSEKKCDNYLTKGSLQGLGGLSGQDLVRATSDLLKAKTASVKEDRAELIARFKKITPQPSEALIKALKEQDESRKGGFSLGTEDTERLRIALEKAIANDPIVSRWPNHAQEQLGWFVRVSGRSSLPADDALLTAWHLADDPHLSKEARDLLDVIQTDFKWSRAWVNALSPIFWGDLNFSVDHRTALKEIYDQALAAGLVGKINHPAVMEYIGNHGYLRDGFFYTVVSSVMADPYFAWIMRELRERGKEAKANPRLDHKRAELSALYSQAYRHAEALAIIDFLQEETNSILWAVSLVEVENNYYHPAMHSVEDVIKKLELAQKAKRNRN